MVLFSFFHLFLSCSLIILCCCTRLVCFEIIGYCSIYVVWLKYTYRSLLKLKILKSPVIFAKPFDTLTAPLRISSILLCYIFTGSHRDWVPQNIFITIYIGGNVHDCWLPSVQAKHYIFDCLSMCLLFSHDWFAQYYAAEG